MDEPIRIAICEDTPSESERLCSILKKCSLKNIFTVFKSGEELLSSYQPLDYDLILMDIYMEGLNGLDTIARIREFDQDVPVAFITTSLDHTLESYRLSALMYIEKPYGQKEIEDILHLAKMKIDSSPYIIVSRNNVYEKIRLSQITCIEQHARLVRIYIRGGEMVEIYDKISNIMAQISGNNFFSPHKSYAVNLAYVKEIDEELKSFIMQDGRNIPIRRESMSEARKVFAEYLFDFTRRK